MTNKELHDTIVKAQFTYAQQQYRNAVINKLAGYVALIVVALYFIYR